MNLAEAAFNARLDELPDLIRERIRGSRLEASLQTDPIDGRPRTYHPLPNFRTGPDSEIWEQEQQHLGRGGNGCVVVLQSKVWPRPRPGGPPERRAVKIIPVYDRYWKYYLREVDAMIKFSNKGYSHSFVSFLGWYRFDYDDRLHLVTEYCERGDLKSYIQSQVTKCLPENEVKEIAWQVLSALRLMHGEKCVHGDIKSSNVLVIQHPPEYWWVKVCDLGLSKRVEQTTGSNGATSTHFSPGYCPPEKSPIFDDHRNIDGYKADMWCFGELIFQALTGRASFKSTKDLDTWYRTRRGYPDQLLRDLQISEDAIDFLHSVMAGDPSSRLTSELACGHRWILPDSRPGTRRFAPNFLHPERRMRTWAPDAPPQSPINTTWRESPSFTSHYPWPNAVNFQPYSTQMAGGGPALFASQTIYPQVLELTPPISAFPPPPMFYQQPGQHLQSMIDLNRTASQPEMEYPHRGRPSPRTYGLGFPNGVTMHPSGGQQSQNRTKMSRNRTYGLAPASRRDNATTRPSRPAEQSSGPVKDEWPELPKRSAIVFEDGPVKAINIPIMPRAKAKVAESLRKASTPENENASDEGGDNAVDTQGLPTETEEHAALKHLQSSDYGPGDPSSEQEIFQRFQETINMLTGHSFDTPGRQDRPGIPSGGTGDGESGMRTITYKSPSEYTPDELERLIDELEAKDFRRESEEAEFMKRRQADAEKAEKAAEERRRASIVVYEQSLRERERENQSLEDERQRARERAVTVNEDIPSAEAVASETMFSSLSRPDWFHKRRVSGSLNQTGRDVSEAQLPVVTKEHGVPADSGLGPQNNNGTAAGEHNPQDNGHPDQLDNGQLWTAVPTRRRFRRSTPLRA